MQTELRLVTRFVLLSAFALCQAAMPAMADGKTLSRANPLPTEHLRTLHKQMIAGRTLGTRDLRALADAADGLAAFKYGKWLEDQDQPQLLPDAAHYYAIASYTDRDFAVRRLVALLELPDLLLAPARQQEAMEAMLHQAQTGNADAAFALSRMYASGRPFGKDPDESLRWLEVAANAGRGDAAVKLALAYMVPTDGRPADLIKARAALDMAAAQPDPGTKAMAQTLLARLGDLPPLMPDVTEGATE